MVTITKAPGCQCAPERNVQAFESAHGDLPCTSICGKLNEHDNTDDYNNWRNCLCLFKQKTNLTVLILPIVIMSPVQNVVMNKRERKIVPDPPFRCRCVMSLSKGNRGQPREQQPPSASPFAWQENNNNKKGKKNNR